MCVCLCNLCMYILGTEGNVVLLYLCVHLGTMERVALFRIIYTFLIVIRPHKHGYCRNYYILQSAVKSPRFTSGFQHCCFD